MKKELEGYIGVVEGLIESRSLNEKTLCRIRVNIGFFQHERLIHLIVTMTFALLTVGALCMCFCTISFIPVFLLFLGLEIPYIAHYYKLENGVQKLQRKYRECEDIVYGETGKERESEIATKQ